MKILVVYKSISGFTKRYAEWISSELDADCISLDEVGTLTLGEYDLVVFGGSLHAVGINGYRRFKTYIPEIGSDKVIVFAVGASPAREGIGEEVKSANLTDTVDQGIPLFYLRGGFDYSKLDFRNKILMTLLKWKLILKRNKTSDDKGMLSAYKNPLDAARPKNIEPIVSYIRSNWKGCQDN